MRTLSAHAGVGFAGVAARRRGILAAIGTGRPSATPDAVRRPLVAGRAEWAARVRAADGGAVRRPAIVGRATRDALGGVLVADRVRPGTVCVGAAVELGPVTAERAPILFETSRQRHQQQREEPKCLDLRSEGVHESRYLSSSAPTARAVPSSRPTKYDPFSRRCVIRHEVCSPLHTIPRPHRAADYTPRAQRLRRARGPERITIKSR